MPFHNSWIAHHGDSPVMFMDIFVSLLALVNCCAIAAYFGTFFAVWWMAFYLYLWITDPYPSPSNYE